MTYVCLSLWPMGSFVLLYKDHIEIPRASALFFLSALAPSLPPGKLSLPQRPGFIIPFIPTRNYLLLSLSSHVTLLITVYSLYNLNPNPDGENV